MEHLLLSLLQQDTMKALTLTEPYATLIALGAKHNETRSWGTDHRGPVAIHTAKRFTRDDESVCNTKPFKEALTKGGYRQDQTARRNQWHFPLGYVVALAWLEDVVLLPHITSPDRDYPPEPERSFGNYAPNRCIWKFSEVYPLHTPLPAQGALLLWQWQPPDTLWNELQQAYRDAYRQTHIKA